MEMKWGKLFKIILDYSRVQTDERVETARQVRRSFVVGVGWVSSVKRRRPWAFFSETASFLCWQQQWISICPQFVHWKTPCKDSFSCFPLLCSIKKVRIRKIIFGQYQKFDLFLETFFIKFFRKQCYLTSSQIRKVRRIFFNLFKVVIKYWKIRQFYRKYLLENDSFSKKHHCRNKQSVELKPHHFEKANMDR